MVVVGLCTTKDHCTSERPLPLAAKLWCDVPGEASRTAGFRVTNARARRCAGGLLGGGAARALATQARRAAVVMVGPCTMKDHCTSERPLQLAAKPWCGVPGKASYTAGVRVTNTRARHCAGYLLGGGAVRELVACARRAAMGVISSCAIECHCTSGRPLPLGARPWCDVFASASNTGGFCVTNARARHCAGYLLGGSAARALAMRARHAAMVIIGPCAIKGHCTSGGLSYSLQGRGAMYQVRPLAQPAFA